MASSIWSRHAEGGRLEVELARLDLGEVENVVDDRQQRFGRVAGRLEVLPLLARQLGVEHQIGHAEDGVHRRADFVAHVGEEGALGVAGGFGGLHRLPQGDFHLLALGDVDADAEDGRLAVVLDDGGREVGPHLVPLFRDDFNFIARADVFSPLPCRGALDHERAEIGMHVINKTAVQEFLPRVTHHRFGRRIDVDVSRPLKDGDHGGHRLGHRAEAVLAHREGLFGLFALGDLALEFFGPPQRENPRDDGDQRHDGGPGEGGRQHPQHRVKPVNGPAEEDRLHEKQRAAGEQKSLEDPEGARHARVLAAEDVVIERDEGGGKSGPGGERREDMQPDQRPAPMPVEKQGSEPLGLKQRREKVEHVSPSRSARSALKHTRRRARAK